MYPQSFLSTFVHKTIYFYSFTKPVLSATKSLSKLVQGILKVCESVRNSNEYDRQLLKSS